MILDTILYGGISTGVGFLSSIIGGSQARKQQEDMINTMMKINNQNLERQTRMAQPFIQAGLNGMINTYNFTNEMNAKRFQSNPIYEQERRNSIAEANRQIAQGQKSAAYTFSNNQGRARGEQYRTARQGVAMKNNSNLNWAKMDDQYKMNNLNNYLNGVSMLNNFGHTGTNIMTSAYNNYTQNAINIAGMQPKDTTWSDLGGSLMGFGSDMLMNGLFNNNKGTTTPNTHQPVDLQKTIELNLPTSQQIIDDMINERIAPQDYNLYDLNKYSFYKEQRPSWNNMNKQNIKNWLLNGR